MSFLCKIVLIFNLFGYVLTGTYDKGKEIVVNKSVVQINYRCSGFIVRNGIVVTAAHCIIPNSLQIVTFYNHVEKKFVPLYVGLQTATANDFAILAGNTLQLRSLSLTKRWPKPGEFIAHIGYSEGKRAQFMTKGLYDKHMCTEKTGCEHYVICYIVPGDSGGPLISSIDMKVFGMIHSSYWPAGIPYGVGAPATNIIKKLGELLGDEVPSDTLKSKMQEIYLF